MLQFYSQQQSRLREQIAAQNARFETLTSKPPAARKAEPPKYHGTLSENLELRFFTIEQYYADYHPLMVEESPSFVTMISCHLASTPMNWYRHIRTTVLYQQGLRKETNNHLREHHPATLEETIQLALRFDHGLQRPAQASSDWEKTATCHRCKAVVHIAPNCPNK
ncbi:hypothetical protein PPTG_21711 [Phytophthora nicotianae INRA-310]|uniref:CCHC-type domain-containing protein n=1 Tax=Phytophthora nicotianae (strain INRA-310) TaxID=761204 RepID=W2QY75_PHYN3|nr:hypothetical protein PPTG_21711 [Phytophthora nicotianae INRA-310]ETN17911.1 hypothetical protein PPTG_21711 [Phytophthora nicotianae INRA-310]